MSNKPFGKLNDSQKNCRNKSGYKEFDVFL